MRLRSGSNYTTKNPVKESSNSESANLTSGTSQRKQRDREPSVSPEPNSHVQSLPHCGASVQLHDHVSLSKADTVNVADLGLSLVNYAGADHSSKSSAMEEFSVSDTVSRLTQDSSLSEFENLEQEAGVDREPTSAAGAGGPGSRYRGNNHHEHSAFSDLTVQRQAGLHDNNTQAGGTPPRDKLRPHNKWVIRGLRTVATFLVLMYLILPAFVKLNPWIMAEVTFLSRIHWPPFINVSSPGDFSLNYTRNFQLKVNDEVTLGAWHILPKSFHREDVGQKDFEAALKSGKPIILYLHGNAGTRGGWHRVQLYRVLAMQDFHVIAVDYRGFADSTGFPSEDGVVEDGLAMYHYIREHSANAPIVIWGHSLGSAIGTKVAKEISAQGHPLTAVVLEAPFNNILDAALKHPFGKPFRIMPWYTWVFIEGLHANGISFATDQSIASVTAPVLILHAEDDGIVPYELGRQLYETARNTKQKGGLQFTSFEKDHGYGHKHIHKAPNLPTVIRDFINEHSK